MSSFTGKRKVAPPPDGIDVLGMRGRRRWWRGTACDGGGGAGGRVLVGGVGRERI